MGYVQIFIGKGGVGKSTCSSLYAFRRALDGKSTLLNSLDPAHNLHDIFLCRLTGKEKKITPLLHIRETDMAQIQQSYIRGLKKELSGIYHHQQAINVDKYFRILKFSPGMEEYSAWLALEGCYNEKRFDSLVIDTPPTALTLKTLALSSVNLHWINQLEQMRREIVDKKNSVGRIRRENLICLDEDPVFSRLQKMKARYQRILDSLRDKKMTELVLILNEDELSFSESLKIRDDLEELSLSVGRVIINKSRGDSVWEERIGEAFDSSLIEIFPWSSESLTSPTLLEKESLKFRPLS